MSCQDSKDLLSRIGNRNVGIVKIMEVCGTHTMAIAKSGLRSALPENIKLLSGPGCPVCVTPAEVIDEILSLAKRDNVIIATYGDMIKVPGSRRGENLGLLRAYGARVEIVYSPIDAVRKAAENPKDEVVFIGAGFETTAPGTAASIGEAKDSGIKNFSVFSLLKTVEPALRALIADTELEVSGFLCPGHVATIIGEKGFSFLSDEFNIPCAIGGFEPCEIITALDSILAQIESGKVKLTNNYPTAVRKGGNPVAARIIETYLTPRRDIWRGLGVIEKSGLGIREEFEEFDAEKKFDIRIEPSKEKSPCRCGDVICGKITPKECPLFGKVCIPEDPVGPCMVSSEGACAAAYKYGEE
ncbi:MAG: hydrogenase formation protein HypD [Ruminococcaceae bacterium]|nr:hydrogenase formation protein HypD [Oscillospiraceae bacterium]